MTYIHELKNWPLFTCDIEYLLPTLTETYSLLGHLTGVMSKLDKTTLAEARYTVLLEDIQANNSLESIHVPSDEAERRFARLLKEKKQNSPTGKISDLAIPLKTNQAKKTFQKSSKKQTATEQDLKELDGLIKTHLDVFHNRKTLLTANRLGIWHRDIAGDTRENSAVAWRTVGSGPKRIVYGPLGWEKIQFEAPEAGRVAQEMKSFLAWFNFGKSSQEGDKNSVLKKTLWQDPLLRAAVAHFWFITIHPFFDGSGRIARVITDLALHNMELACKDFFSFSARMAQERSEYYTALKNCQKNSLDLTPWLNWFLHALGRATSQAEEILALVLNKEDWRKMLLSPGLKPRQQLILEKMLAGDLKKITSSMYAQVAVCSPDSALRDIQQMIQSGILSQNQGGGRSTSYSLRRGIKK